MSQAELRAALLRATDLAGQQFAVDDQGGMSPTGVFSFSHAVVSDEPPAFGPFGVIANADVQPCSHLLNAFGYGKNAPIADAWAETGFVGSDGSTLLNESVASFPADEAPKVVSGVATAATCGSVHSRRAGRAMTLELKSLAVPALGNAHAGVEVMESEPTGIAEQVLVVIQIGESVILIDGLSPGSASGTAEFDRNLLNRALAQAVARLEAVR
jgi:hypothetical protein